MSTNGIQVIRAIRAAANRQPDKIVTDCVYVSSEFLPSCLVGHGLWNTGLIDFSFKDDFKNVEQIWLLSGKFGFDRIETRWLAKVQETQDNQQFWSVAVRDADALCPLGTEYQLPDAHLEVPEAECELVNA